MIVLETSNKTAKYAIGIDLGRTNSAVGVWEQDKVKLITSEEGIFINI